MNDVIQTLTNHRSYRLYEDRPVGDKELDLILQAAQAAPSWINGQQVSILVIREEERKQKLAELAGNQKHVAAAPVFLVFCADFYRAAQAAKLEDAPFEAVKQTDALLVGATDVGLAMGNAIAAAESLGLGIIPIGGVRRMAMETAELLNLPRYVFPIAGLCIGYPAGEVSQKPRLPKQAVVHKETYDTEASGDLAAYNETYRAYTRAQSGGEQDNRWSQLVARFYGPPHYVGQYTQVAEMLRKQGFDCDDIREKK